MRIVLYIYAGIYLLFSISVVVDDIKDKHPVWRIGADASLALVAFVGMVFYFLDVRNSALILAWRPISLVLLGGQIFINFYERHLVLAGNDPAMDRRRLSPGAVWAADAVTMLMVLPALTINLIFAYF